MISSITSAVIEEFSARMIGIPPPTLASKRKLMFLSLAMDRSSAPCFATSALLDVATLLPASRQRFTKVYAGSMPPMTSTTIRISGSFTIVSKSWMIFSWIGSPGKSLRSSTYFTLISSPALCVITLWFRLRTSTTPDPTVPYPITAIFTITSSLSVPLKSC